MKKISRKGLDRIIDNGWEIDGVTPPEPKQPLLTDLVAEGIKEVSVENQKVVAAMAKSIAQFIAAQSAALEKKTEAVVKMPEGKKKTWEFKVTRDDKGFIKNVVAKEL